MYLKGILGLLYPALQINATKMLSDFHTKVIERITSHVGVPLCPQRDLVLVTGGSKGVGMELAQLFDTLHYKVIILDRRYPEDLRSCKNVSFYKCDVSDFEFTNVILDDIRLKFGIVSVYVNAVGLKVITDKDIRGEFHMTSLMKSVYVGNLNILQSIVPNMIRQKRGYIVDIASTEGVFTTSGNGFYGCLQATKFQLHQGLVEDLSKQFVVSKYFGNGSVRCLLMVTSKPLNVTAKHDIQHARYIFNAIFHNRQGITGASVVSNLKLSFRDVDWHWYQLLKHLFPDVK